jgi:hypothetical protein
MVKLMAQVYYHDGRYKIAVSESGSSMLHAKFVIQKISKNLILCCLCAVCRVYKQAMTNTTNVFINTQLSFKAYLSQVAFRIEPTLMAHTVGA